MIINSTHIISFFNKDTNIYTRKDVFKKVNTLTEEHYFEKNEYTLCIGLLKNVFHSSVVWSNKHI